MRIRHTLTAGAAAAFGVLIVQPLVGAATALTVAPVTLPSATVPSLSTPALNTPAVKVPSVTTPAVKVPPVTTPAVTTPAVKVPPVTTPAVTTPAVKVPSVTVPSVTVPPVTAPAVHTPAATTPALTTPSVHTPAVHTPTITTPRVSTPSATGTAGRLSASRIVPRLSVSTPAAPATAGRGTPGAGGDQASLTGSVSGPSGRAARLAASAAHNCRYRLDLPSLGSTTSQGPARPLIGAALTRRLAPLQGSAADAAALAAATSGADVSSDPTGRGVAERRSAVAPTHSAATVDETPAAILNGPSGASPMFEIVLGALAAGVLALMALPHRRSDEGAVAAAAGPIGEWHDPAATGPVGEWHDPAAAGPVGEWHDPAAARPSTGRDLDVAGAIAAAEAAHRAARQGAFDTDESDGPLAADGPRQSLGAERPAGAVGADTMGADG